MPRARDISPWANRDQLWLRHLELAVVREHRFERQEGPRLRPLPDWSRTPVANVTSLPPRSWPAKKAAV
jgi:hypothetical protein